MENRHHESDNINEPLNTPEEQALGILNLLKSCGQGLIEVSEESDDQEGSYVQELMREYNSMLRGLKNYVDKLEIGRIIKTFTEKG
ncbi:hypothetical protein phytr_11100 [Candidatus Phycorickettsia trachydisci]|uniref:Uncharacterized protein n=1 Tax=Candidatus Phycorickettsia trachydisci TaxID=2115978 RepID=A0A2P1P9W5_9RICK|nr:hypothetical protein [Candidatus Phycorickettsia trachydisci]AVP88035.1 hypothetical protein phytr_11100 [Candidatus Phycorickettsia trachydisci]